MRETEVRACARRSRFRLGFLVCLCDDGCFFDYDYIATDSSGLPAVIGARSNRSSLLETPTAVLEAERAYRVWIGALRRCLGEPPADTSCRTSRFERRAAVMVCSTLDTFFCAPAWSPAVIRVRVPSGCRFPAKRHLAPSILSLVGSGSRLRLRRKPLSRWLRKRAG